MPVAPRKSGERGMAISNGQRRSARSLADRGPSSSTVALANRKPTLVVRGVNRESTMSITAFAVAALLSSAPAAFAAPASVTVSVGPELQQKAAEKYGVRDVDRLAAELRKDVERELARTGAYDGARIELVL